MPLLLRRQGRGRLIENDDLRLVLDGARDLHHLALGGAERRDDGGGIDGEVQRLQELLGGDIDAAQAVQELLVAQIEILRHRHGRDQAGFLEHHGDAGLQRLGGRGEADLPAAIEHAPAAGDDGAGHDLGQGRFAGAILADQRVDLASFQVEIDVLDRRHAAIGLGQLLHFEDDRLAHASLPARQSISSSALPPFDEASTRPFASTTLVMPWRLPLARLWKLAIGRRSASSRTTRP